MLLDIVIRVVLLNVFRSNHATAFDSPGAISSFDGAAIEKAGFDLAVGERSAHFSC